jgi:four helix bundle protein
MNSLRNYQDLEVWKKSIVLVETAYAVSRGFPLEERFGLTSQLRRAAVSVPANIAEGSERTSTGEFLQGLSVARGSLAEVETLVIVAARLEMVSSEDRDRLLEQAREVGRMLIGLQRSLRSKR